MEQIEKALGKKIMRIETNDLDEMEEVCIGFGHIKIILSNVLQKMKQALK
jgi:hypothetical protein